MNQPVLFVVVAVQILAFQFLSLRLTRSLPDYLVGQRGLPEPVATRVEHFKHEAGRARQWIGILLWAAAVVFMLLPFHPLAPKLGLAAISLISTTVFAFGFVYDRRTIRRMSGELPDPTVRTASLAQRSLGQHYPVAWEAVPLTFVAATIAMTLWGTAGAAAGGRWSLVVYPAVQLFLVLGGLLLSVHAARSGRSLPQRARPYVGSAESAAATGEALRTLELRFSLAARIGVALMFALMQAPRVLAATGSKPPFWLDLSHWVVLGLLFALFVAFGLKVSGMQNGLGGNEVR